MAAAISREVSETSLDRINVGTRSHIQSAAVVIRVLIGIILIYAAIPKLSFPERFLNTVMMYNIAPSGVNILIAATLPWLELLIGVCLILGIAVQGAIAASAGLFITYSVALVSVHHRGLAFDCGCFGTMSGHSSTLDASVIGRTVVLAVVASALAINDLARTCGWQIDTFRQATK